MAIKSVELKNFTVFEGLKIDFSPGLNVIIGENGTGKTHLLKTLYSFSGVTSDPCLFGAETDEGYFISSLTDCFGVAGCNELIRKPSDCTEKPIMAVLHVHSDEGNCICEIKEASASCQLSNDNKLFPSIFIPSKDMLTHSRGLLTMAKKHSKDMPFDKTLLDIIKDAENWKVDETPTLTKNIAPLLEEVIGGKIVQKDGDFFVVKSNGEAIRFSCESEGVKKFGLLWQLLMATLIRNGSVLFWDEPEANLNPMLIPVVAEILLELSRNGVQIFLATHDYMLAKSFEVKQLPNDLIRFHSLYKSHEGVKTERNENFRDLKENPIIVAYDKLLDEVIRLNLGD